MVNVSTVSLRLFAIPTGLSSSLTCSKGWLATPVMNLSKPSLLLSMTSSVNRFVKTFPGKGGMFTLVVSRSRMSLKYSKSE